MKRFDRSTSSVAFGIPVALAAIACAGPGGDAPGGLPFAIRDSAGIEIVSNTIDGSTPVCTLGEAPLVSIGLDEGPEEYQLYRVFGAVRLSDGRIVLVNGGSQEIRFYDADGTFTGRAGREGDGPGEFSDAFLIWRLPGDTVVVGDYPPWRFHLFGPEGAWARTAMPEPQYPNNPDRSAVLDDGRAILGRRAMPEYGPDYRERRLTVRVHGPEGELLDSLGTFADGRWGQLNEGVTSALFGFPLFESFSALEGHGDRVFLGHQSEASIRVLEGADRLEVRRIVRWDPGDRTISPEHIEAERARLSEPYRDRDAETRRQFLDPLISESRPVADRFPTYIRLGAGVDGRMWVREYPRPGEDGPHRWLVFDAAGRIECRVSVPPFDEIYEFGPDYLLVKNPTELGVERVEVYSLRGAGGGG